MTSRSGFSGGPIGQLKSISKPRLPSAHCGVQVAFIKDAMPWAMEFFHVEEDVDPEEGQKGGNGGW